MKSPYLVFIATLSLTTSLVAAQSAEGVYSDAGIRIGMDGENRIDLMSYEVFGTIDLGWMWDLSENIRLDLDIETAIGALSGEGETAVYGRIAPVAEFYYDDCPVSLTLSSGPSVYSEDTFDRYDIGGNFQFTSSAGLNWELNDFWTIGYRFQHTSNGHMSSPNPGLDMHTLSAAYTF